MRATLVLNGLTWKRQARANFISTRTFFFLIFLFFSKHLGAFRTIFERNSNRVISKPVTFAGLIRIESVFYEIYLVFVYIVCTPPFCWEEGGVEPPTEFLKRGGLDRFSILRGVAEKKGVDFFRERGCSFFIKNKLNLKYLMTKNYKTKLFFFVTTKNLN